MNAVNGVSLKSDDGMERGMRYLPGVLLALVVAGYPVAGLLSASLDVSSRTTSLPFRGLVAAIALILLVRGWQGRRFGFWVCLLGVWWVVYAARLVSNLWQGFPGAGHELAFFCLTVILPALALLKSEPDQAESSAGRILLFLGSLVGGGALLGEFLGVFGWHSLMYTGRLSTDTVNPITLGQVAASFLLVLVATRIPRRTTGSWWVFVPLAAMGLACLGYAGSRGAFVSLLVALAFLWLAQRCSHTNDRPGQIAVPCLVGLVVALFFFPLPTEQLIVNSEMRRQSLPTDIAAIAAKQLADHQILAQQDRSGFRDMAVAERITLARNAFGQFLSHPLNGGANWEANDGAYPHNLPLEAFSNLGVVGGVVFLILMGAGIRFAWRRTRDGTWLISLLYVQALASAMFSGSLYGHAQLWTTLTMLLGSQAIFQVERKAN